MNSHFSQRFTGIPGLALILTLVMALVLLLAGLVLAGCGGPPSSPTCVTVENRIEDLEDCWNAKNCEMTPRLFAELRRLKDTRYEACRRDLPP